MMSIADQFGRKRTDKQAQVPVERAEPAIVRPVPRNTLHPAVREATERHALDLQAEFDAMRADLDAARNALEVERRHRQQLEKMLAVAIDQKDFWKTYAIEISSGISQVAGHLAFAGRMLDDLAKRANNNASVPGSKVAEDAIKAIEKELGELSQEAKDDASELVSEGAEEMGAKFGNAAEPEVEDAKKK